jgi:hypothetical protein
VLCINGIYERDTEGNNRNRRNLGETIATAAAAEQQERRGKKRQPKTKGKNQNTRNKMNATKNYETKKFQKLVMEKFFLRVKEKEVQQRRSCTLYIYLSLSLSLGFFLSSRQANFVFLGAEKQTDRHTQNNTTGAAQGSASIT